MHTNRLKNETSPYLLQHAHNPVNWYPWGEEAITEAKKQDKPILVSIGYAACHWCHVMERESFEDEETAALMNRLFINIKVDREERPDVDHIYMDAVQAMTGSGGWPLNVFLTPDLKPFYGGTYFPPVRAYNRMSWKELLAAVYNTYKEKRDEIETQAKNLTDHIANANTFIGGSSENFTKEDLLKISSNIMSQADSEWGGFGAAPKFPHSFLIQYQLRDYYFFGNELSLHHALLSLDKLIQGGIYDQLAGGFARYSTDEKWLAPHFEKMLYDNALIVETLCEAYQITKDPAYKKVILQTFDFIRNELMSEEFGFYAAYDADSEGVEGKYYTWSKSEIVELLGDDADFFCDVFDVTEHGNWEETNILWLPEKWQGIAAEWNFPEDEAEQIIERCKSRLSEKRVQRVKPALDDKQLLNWNALMNACCSKIAAALENEEARDLAVNNMQFIQTKLFKDSLHHTYKNGEAKIQAFLDDYAYLIRALLLLQEITGDFEYLKFAESLTEEVLKKFSDNEQLMFYFTSIDQKDIIVRKKEVYDGATPSANAVMAENLRALSLLIDKPEWGERAASMIQSLKKAVVQYPTSFGWWAKLIIENFRGIEEVAIVGPQASGLSREYLTHFHPNRVLQHSNTESVEYPLLRDKFKEAESRIFLCKAYSCKHPVNTVDQLIAQIRNSH